MGTLCPTDEPLRVETGRGRTWNLGTEISKEDTRGSLGQLVVVIGKTKVLRLLTRPFDLHDSSPWGTQILYCRQPLTLCGGVGHCIDRPPGPTYYVYPRSGVVTLSRSRLPVHGTEGGSCVIVHRSDVSPVGRPSVTRVQWETSSLGSLLLRPVMRDTVTLVQKVCVSSTILRTSRVFFTPLPTLASCAHHYPPRTPEQSCETQTFTVIVPSQNKTKIVFRTTWVIFVVRDARSGQDVAGTTGERPSRAESGVIRNPCAKETVVDGRPYGSG